MTSGNHIWDKNDFGVAWARTPYLSPATFRRSAPARGARPERGGRRLGMNLEGQVFMPPIDSSPHAARLEGAAAQGGLNFHPRGLPRGGDLRERGHGLSFTWDGAVLLPSGTHTHVQDCG